jgi:serpin B
MILALENKNTNNCELSSNMFVLTAKGVEITDECQALLPLFNGVKDDLISANQVNGLVSDYTNGKITQIIDSISGVQSIILNILYFKGEWESEFKFKGLLPFNFNNGNSKNVPMMTLTKERMLYGENALYDYVELKYKNNLSAGIILPKLNVSVRKIVSNFEGLFNSLIEDQLYSMQKVILTMPKFKVESSFELKNVLKSFGITDAFNGNADFSNLYEDAQGLYIDKIIHKTFISVDEKGTEAAAVTAVITTRTSVVVPRRPIIFTVDRPFVFVVFDNETKNNLFTTIVEDFYDA